MSTTRACNSHRWYEPQTGRYTRPDPISKISSNFGHGLLLTSLEPPYAYARANPGVFFDPLGLASVGRALCVTKWIAVGAGVGAGVGEAVGAAAAGGACTFVAPGVGTIGCGAGGASGGAAGGGALGGAIGGLFGSLFCSDDCEADTDERRRTHEHCLRLYEICVSNPGRHRFVDGARCDSCFATCKAQSAWPFDRCQLNYYPHGM